MKVRLQVVTSAEVDAWIDNPHPDEPEREKYQHRVLQATKNIELLGTLANEADLKKLRDGLFETRILDHRLLSTMQGNLVLMGAVALKRKGKLTPREMDNAERRVQRFVAQRAKEKGGK